MDSSSERLCETCAAIDFASLVYAEQDKSGTKPSTATLGDVAQIFRRTHRCHFCALVIEALRERYRQQSVNKASNDYCGYRIYPAKDALGGWSTNLGSAQVPNPWQLEDIHTYGFPVTWSGEPIVCHLTPSFFCFHKGSPRLVRDDGLLELRDQKILRGCHIIVYRLLMELSSSPRISFSKNNSIKLHAIWSGSGRDVGEVEVHGKVISLLGSGRKVNPEIELARVRNWVHQCENSHGSRCARPAWASAKEENALQRIRVIDVRERQVVYLPPHSRYIALSYVWGVEKETVELRRTRSMTTKNSQKLQQPQGLNSILPCTVEDAMALLISLDERYLWVDAFCIIQDDVADLDFHTSQMDIIYSGAFFTILSACGDNSDAGLAGMPGRPRNIFHQYARVSRGGLCLATMADFMNESLPNSKWNSRGWTFQERLLSKRALVFTKSQLYWLCECSMWDEETILEPTDPPVWVLPQALGCNDEWDDGYPKFSKEALRVYVAQYSTRHFTFPGDTLRAFLGILRRYEQLNQETTLWGLPTNRFDQSLNWRVGRTRRKELHTFVSDIDRSSIHIVQFPSLSWLGWTDFISLGPYNKALEDVTRSGHSRSELTFYSLMSNGTTRRVNKPDDGLYVANNYHLTGLDPRKDAIPLWKGGTGIAGPTIDYEQVLSFRLPQTKKIQGIKSDDSPVYNTGRLIFWTSHTRVTAWSSDASSNTLCVDAGGRILELEVGRNIGKSLWADDTLFETENPESMLQRQMVLLLGYEGAKRTTVDMIVISRFYRHDSGEETTQLNIMIVKEDETERGIWTRVDMAVIEEDDWLSFERVWTMVILG